MPLNFIDEDGVGGNVPIPPGLRPRILDMLSEMPPNPLKPVIHRASHFALGVEASQYFLLLADDYMTEEREAMECYAPHPFETYTLSLFVGSEGRMVEDLIVVNTTPAGTPQASCIMLPWGDSRPVNADHPFTLRARDPDIMSMSKQQMSELEEIVGYEAALTRGAWTFIDVFRLILSRPNNIRSTTAGPPRHAIRKGKRTTYYSASEITIDIDEVKRSKTMVATGYGKIMPGYRYRAHLCHSGGDRACTHEWIEIGGHMDAHEVWHPAAEHGKQNATWQCYHCDRKRWHRRQGERGDSSIGRVRQTYKIKKGKNDIVPEKQKED